MSYPDELATLKTPPHSLEAEQSVIGGLLVAPAAWDVVAEILDAGDFYRPEHQIIFEHIAKLADAGTPIDTITLADAMEQGGSLERAGGIAYLIDIVRSTPSAANIRAYAEAVRGRATLRKLVQAGHDIAEAGFDAKSRSSADLVDWAESRVMELRTEREISAEDNKAAMRALLDIWERRNATRGEPTGLPSGWKDIDTLTMGWQPGNLIVLAARPGMGKTTFALNSAEHAALNLGKRVLFFSMEMTKEELLEKVMSSAAKIPFALIRSGMHLEDEDHKHKVIPYASKIIECGLVIDDRSSLHVQQIRAKARAMHRRSPLSLIVVDYIQLGRSDGQNREQEVSAISRGLKALAKELRIPIIALSQLSRKCEERMNKRPIMSDLRESGGIEQDADMVLFLYRDEVYNENSDRKGIAEVIFGKYRGGETGTKYLASRLNMSRFDDVVFNPANVVPIQHKRGRGIPA